MSYEFLLQRSLPYQLVVWLMRFNPDAPATRIPRGPEGCTASRHRVERQVRGICPSGDVVTGQRKECGMSVCCRGVRRAG